MCKIKYKAPFLQLGNEWVKDEVLLKLVGSVFNLKLEHEDIEFVVTLEDDLLCLDFESVVYIPNGLYYMDVAFSNISFDENCEFTSIGDITEVRLVTNHVNPEIGFIRKVS